MQNISIGEMIIELNEAVTNDNKMILLLAGETGINPSMIAEILSNVPINQAGVKILYGAFLKIEEAKKLESEIAKKFSLIF